MPSSTRWRIGALCPAWLPVPSCFSASWGAPYLAPCADGHSPTPPPPLQREYYDVESFWATAEEMELPFVQEAMPPEMQPPKWTRQQAEAL